MHPVKALHRLGGVADHSALLRYTSRGAIRRAVRRGDAVRERRGTYSLPGADEARRAATRLHGTLVGPSAALQHGWPVAQVPREPMVAVPRNRKIDRSRRVGVDLRYRTVAPDDVSGRVTRPVRTVMDSAAMLDFAEALAIADSALRSGQVDREELLLAAQAEPDRYRARCVRVARAADASAENPFESVLRAIALDVPGLNAQPQVWVTDSERPDLVDAALGIIMEADSFEFHGRRKELVKDCRRYNGFVVAGWLVLRFSYEHVMHQREYVRATLLAAVRLRTEPQRRALGGRSGVSAR